MNPLHDLTEVRNALGNPPRKLGWFAHPPIQFPKPDWAKDVNTQKDLLLKVFDLFRDLYKNGKIVWGRVMRANVMMFAPGENDCPGLVLYSLADPDDLAVERLEALRNQLVALRDREEPVPGWTTKEQELWEDLNEDMSYQGGCRVPPAWSPPEREYRLSTILFHRGHLPDGYLQSDILPILVQPHLPFAPIVVPFAYWPDALKKFLSEPSAPLASGRTNIALREEAYQRELGEMVSVFHETEVRGEHIDIYLFGPREPLNHYVYLSGGMSDHPIPNDDAGCRRELIFYATERSLLLANFIRQFAHYPSETGSCFRDGDLVPLGKHAEACLGTDRFPFLLFRMAVRHQDLRLPGCVAIDSDPILPIMVIPLSEAEATLVKESGLAAFDALVKRPESPSLIFDPERKSLC